MKPNREVKKPKVKGNVSNKDMKSAVKSVQEKKDDKQHNTLGHASGKKDAQSRKK